MDNREQRREEVLKLLERGTALKLLSSCSDEALALLLDAHELATREPVLPEPLPALTAYRCAHLILRRAYDLESLLDAEELMKDAAACEDLGPLPAVYHLPILHRISMLKPECVPPERMRAAFGRATKRVQEVSSSAPESVRNEDDLAERLERIDAQKQHHLVNMLELSAFFMGLDYAPLEGMEGPFFDLFPGDRYKTGWVLLGQNPYIENIRVPKQLALAELETRRKEAPNALYFKLSQLEGTREWGVGPSSPKQAPENDLLILACCLDERYDTLEKVHHRLYEHPNQGTFRTAKSRLLAKLSKLLGLSPNEVFCEDPTCNVPRFHPDIQVVAAVDRDTLYPHSHHGR